jgi:hypothetical protein
MGENIKINLGTIYVKISTKEADDWVQKWAPMNL